jgi:hypothetical protein
METAINIASFVLNLYSLWTFTTAKTDKKQKLAAWAAIFGIVLSLYLLRTGGPIGVVLFQSVALGIMIKRVLTHSKE